MGEAAVVVVASARVVDAVCRCNLAAVSYMATTTDDSAREARWVIVLSIRFCFLCNLYRCYSSLR